MRRLIHQNMKLIYDKILLESLKRLFVKIQNIFDELNQRLDENKEPPSVKKKLQAEPAGVNQ